MDQGVWNPGSKRDEYQTLNGLTGINYNQNNCNTIKRKNMLIIIMTILDINKKGFKFSRGLMLILSFKVIMQ